MKKLFLLLLLPIFISTAPPKFSGTIVDSETSETLTGVTIENSTEKTYSDFDGQFSINGFKPTFQFISYKVDSISNDTIYMSGI